MKIGSSKIGIGEKVFLIAEAGVNYNNKLDLAYKMIDIAKKNGVDAIKFQTWKTEKMQMPNSKKPNYQKQIKNKNYYELIKSLEPSFNEQKKIFRYCKKLKIQFLSTPYDEESVDFLDELGVTAFKISASDLTNHILLKHIASKNKPIILSTGIATLKEVDETINFLKKIHMKNKMILLQTTSSYPTHFSEVNLKVITNYIKRYNLPVGLSDHTINEIASLGAVALGACVLEKHFTLDKSLPGPDQSSSLEPLELEKWVKNVKILEKELGTSKKMITESEKKNSSMKKMLVIKSGVKGDKIQKEDIFAMRTIGKGVLPLDKNIRKIIGKKLKKDIHKTTNFSWNMIFK